METLQYNSFFPVSSFLSSDPLHCQPHPHPYRRPSLPCQSSNNIYQYSTSPTSLSTPVTEISDTLNAITVSSPESPPQTPLPLPPVPSQSRPSRVRRNLSLSMDNWSPPPTTSSPNPSSAPLFPSYSAPDLSITGPKTSLSLPTLRECVADDVLVVDHPQGERKSPCKSPKRTRGDVEVADEDYIASLRDDALSRGMESPQTPLVRSASATHLGREGGRGRARSLLMKSDQNFSRRGESLFSCALPAFYGPHPDLQYVTPQTVVDLLDGKFKEVVDEYHIIDCRFPYEYDGGPLNLTENEIKQKFIDAPRSGKKVAIIFHCEFSSQRAPRCCRFLRELDRKLNIADYPKLTYPDVYVIEGGYKNFFETFESYCIGTYVEMRDERHCTEMKAHIRNIKRVRSMSVDHTAMPFFQPSKLN